MKLSKDEVKKKVNELVEDSDKAIELLESKQYNIFTLSMLNTYTINVV